jgi:uncharacterized protein YcnI
MRFSAWSSRGISACRGAVLALGLALVLAPAAAADVSISPGRVDPGNEARLVFSVANESTSPIKTVAIGLPPDFELGEAEVKGSWKTDVNKRTVTWEGSRIAPGRLATFTLNVRAPHVEEKAMFSVLASLADGRTVTYESGVDVVRPAPIVDRTARQIATAALIVASVAAVVAIAGGLLALWLWLRPRPAA